MFLVLDLGFFVYWQQKQLSICVEVLLYFTSYEYLVWLWATFKLNLIWLMKVDDKWFIWYTMFKRESKSLYNETLEGNIGMKWQFLFVG